MREDKKVVKIGDKNVKLDKVLADPTKYVKTQADLFRTIGAILK